MAVVIRKASCYVDVASPPIALLPAEVDGRGHAAPFVSTVEIANGDSATSQVYFGEIPTNARFSRYSAIDFDAITGVVSFDLGLGQGADREAYVAKSVNCLIAAGDIHLAGSKAFTAVDIANLPLPAWQLAGYTDDPGGTLSVVGTLNNASTAAGTITLSALLQTP